MQRVNVSMLPFPRMIMVTKKTSVATQLLMAAPLDGVVAQCGDVGCKSDKGANPSSKQVSWQYVLAHRGSGDQHTGQCKKRCRDGDQNAHFKQCSHQNMSRER
jgi:hypothetical protein